MKNTVLFLAGVVILFSVVSIVSAQTCTPALTFVADVTVPDDTPFKPGEVFTKTWQLKNSGGCAWEGFSLVHADGDLLGATSPQPLTPAVSPGESVSLSVSMKAPDRDGTYASWWQVQDKANTPVGNKFYVRIAVGNSPTPARRAAAASSSAPAKITGEVREEMNGPLFANKPDDMSDPKQSLYHKDGMLHMSLNKTRRADGEWNQDWSIYRIWDNTFYTDSTIDVEVGRLTGEGWGGGAAEVYFGWQDAKNYYVFMLTRTDQLWAIDKMVDGQYVRVFPPADSPNGMDKGATINDADLMTRQTWDWVKIQTQNVEGGTRIAVYSKGTRLAEVIDKTYKGGAVGLGAHTWGESAHVAFNNLFLFPYMKND
jgi:hypothetical protein